jgi:hypothetical protein
VRGRKLLGGTNVLSTLGIRLVIGGAVKSLIRDLRRDLRRNFITSWAHEEQRT